MKKKQELKLREDTMYWYNHFPVPENIREALFEDIISLIKLDRKEQKREIIEIIEKEIKKMENKAYKYRHDLKKTDCASIGGFIKALQKVINTIK